MFPGRGVLYDEFIGTVSQLLETYAVKKDGYCNGKILTNLRKWLMVNGLFLFAFKTDADLPAVNDITISKMTNGKMKQFDWLSGHVTFWHFRAMPPCSDSSWQLS